jgi:hypothetical protein
VNKTSPISYNKNKRGETSHYSTRKMNHIKTQRPINKCRRCNNTWHPKGKNVSSVCPSCGSVEVEAVLPTQKEKGFIWKATLVALALAAAPGFLGGFFSSGNNYEPAAQPVQAAQPTQPAPSVSPPNSDPSKNCWWFKEGDNYMTGDNCTITSHIESSGQQWWWVQEPTGSSYGVAITGPGRGLVAVNGQQHQMSVERHPVLGQRFRGNGWDFIVRLDETQG